MVLDAYDGTTSEERFLVDAVADIAIDWRSEWVAASWTKDPAVQKRYSDKKLPRFVQALEQYYARPRNGLYLLGDHFTYADILVFTMLHDETLDACALSADAALRRLFTATQQRPGITAYLRRWQQALPIQASI